MLERDMGSARAGVGVGAWTVVSTMKRLHGSDGFWYTSSLNDGRRA